MTPSGEASLKINDSKPRAVIYYAGFRRRSGGAFKHAAETAAELERQGWNVRVFCADDLPLTVRFLPTIAGRVINALAPPLGFYHRGRLAALLFRLFGGHDEADLVIFEEIYISWSVARPAVTLLHATWSDNLHGVLHRAPMKTRLIEREEALLNKIEHPVITVSEEYRDFLIHDLFSDALNKDIKVVPLALDMSALPQKSDRVRQTGFVFTGRLEARKNLLFLMDVFEAFHALHPEWTLTLIGDGPMQEELEARARDRALPVIFLGRLEKAEVFDTLLRNRVYLHTSTKESFSFALLEAKLCGLATCAFGGLQVPGRFIDHPAKSFERDDWLAVLARAVQVGPVHTVDANEYTPLRMLKRTLELAAVPIENRAQCE